MGEHCQLLQVRRCGPDARAGPFTSLRQLLSRQHGGSSHGPAVVEAMVAAVDSGDSSGGPALLHLQDGSTAEPLGMYLHSSLLRLSEGPTALLRGGCSATLQYKHPLTVQPTNVLLRSCHRRVQAACWELPDQARPQEQWPAAQAAAHPGAGHCVQQCAACHGHPEAVPTPYSRVTCDGTHDLLHWSGKLHSSMGAANKVCALVQVLAVVDSDQGTEPFKGAVHAVVRNIEPLQDRSGIPHNPCIRCVPLIAMYLSQKDLA